MNNKYGLIGEKLSHSFSPAIHKLLGDYDYQSYEIEREKLDSFMRGHALAGFNVTIPYKQAVIPYCTELSDRAQSIGSVNTVISRYDGTYYGDNTDYAGFCALLNDSGQEVKGLKAVVLGSGGASKTVCAVLRDRGARVVVISRNGENNYNNLYLNTDADILVNTTPLGMYPNTGVSAVKIKEFKKLRLVLDDIYNPARTELLLQAEELGISAFGGMRMLVIQAVRASELFTGQHISDKIADRLYKKLSSQMKNIVLIGMPGCGKSSIGKKLADELGREFIDTDNLIEEKEKKSIADIFSDIGEVGFRKLETEVYANECKRSGLIISSGGGIVTVEENQRILKANSIVVFINRENENLETEGRPISQKRGVEALYRERLPLYKSWANFVVDNNSNIDDAVKSILDNIL